MPVVPTARLDVDGWSREKVEGAREVLYFLRINAALGRPTHGVDETLRRRLVHIRQEEKEGGK
jgi:hypothetical protein